ncbi:hypothetical protein DL98DRAFT_532955 [Cadophora sp. DSE1049]|nr:hypothetical protein DL98DRAFT_532955 [Cadophora sp. DSE1049]
MNPAPSDPVLARISEPPQELIDMIWQFHINTIPQDPHAIKIKISLPYGTATEPRIQKFNRSPCIPSMQHINQKARSKFETLIPSISSLRQVFDTGLYPHDLRRRIRLPNIPMTERFLRTFHSAGCAREMNVRALALRCGSRPPRHCVVKLAVFFAILKIIYVIKRTESREETLSLARSLYEDLAAKARKIWLISWRVGNTCCYCGCSEKLPNRSEGLNYCEV